MLHYRQPPGQYRNRWPAAPDLAEITFFDALEQVGLKLEQRKLPLQVIVVDRAERPAGN